VTNVSDSGKTCGLTLEERHKFSKGYKDKACFFLDILTLLINSSTSIDPGWSAIRRRSMGEHFQVRIERLYRYVAQASSFQVTQRVALRKSSSLKIKINIRQAILRRENPNAVQTNGHKHDFDRPIKLYFETPIETIGDRHTQTHRPQAPAHDRWTNPEGFPINLVEKLHLRWVIPEMGHHPIGNLQIRQSKIDPGEKHHRLR